MQLASVAKRGPLSLFGVQKRKQQERLLISFPVGDSDRWFGDVPGWPPIYPLPEPGDASNPIQAPPIHTTNLKGCLLGFFLPASLGLAHIGAKDFEMASLGKTSSERTALDQSGLNSPGKQTTL